MKKALIILIFVLLIIIIAIALSNLPFDVSHNANISYEQMDIQMRKVWYWTNLVSAMWKLYHEDLGKLVGMDYSITSLNFSHIFTIA